MNQKTRDQAQYEKMTQTPVSKLIISLAIPTTISMLVTSIYNMADTFFVSQLGTSATGAVGIVFSLMAIIQAVGFTLGMGAGSTIPPAGAAKAKGRQHHWFHGFFQRTGLWTAADNFGIEFCGWTNGSFRSYVNDLALRQRLCTVHSVRCANYVCFFCVE